MIYEVHMKCEILQFFDVLTLKYFFMTINKPNFNKFCISNVQKIMPFYKLRTKIIYIQYFKSYAHLYKILMIKKFILISEL